MTPTHRSAPTTLLLSLCGLFLAVAPALAADRMATGQWQFALATDGGTHTSKHCVTPDEAAGVNGSLASARSHSEQKAARGHCAVKSFDIRGDTVSYALSCGARRIESTSTYHGDSFEGTLTTTAEGKSVLTKVKAQRLGACP